MSSQLKHCTRCNYYMLDVHILSKTKIGSEMGVWQVQGRIIFGPIRPQKFDPSYK